jgi:hypothetical protein
VKLKKVADAYRTNIDGISKMLGYSKQALYYMLSPGKKSICENRAYAAMKTLRQQSEDMYLYDLAKAKVEKQEREELLRQMCKKIGVTDVTNE